MAGTRRPERFSMAYCRRGAGSGASRLAYRRSRLAARGREKSRRPPVSALDMWVEPTYRVAGTHIGSRPRDFGRVSVRRIYLEPRVVGRKPQSARRPRACRPTPRLVSHQITGATCRRLPARWTVPAQAPPQEVCAADPHNRSTCMHCTLHDNACGGGAQVYGIC